MTYEEFRENLDTWWEDTDAREMARKNSQGALLALMDLYEKLSADEQVLADRVIAEWVRSGNDRKRFDALAMVDRFRIHAAGLQLRLTANELATRQDHQAPFELSKVRRIIERLADK